MRSGELIFNIHSSETFQGALAAIDRMDGDLAGAKPQNAPADLSGLAILLGMEGIDLGLTRAETRPLLLAVRELGGNIVHGMLGKVEPGIYHDPDAPEGKGVNELDVAFTTAEFDITDYDARFGIIYDGQTNQGWVFMSHPIIRTSPPLDLEAARQKRRAENERGIGGFDRIEQGHIHKMLNAAGLSHTMLETVDLPINPDDLGQGSKRMIWFTFSRMQAAGI